ncbi:MAG: hypothetical protein P8I25_10110, partial [Ilumatobacter sp.]|nr:hypothetical protein [Ilumatobacter sp.]
MSYHQMQVANFIGMDGDRWGGRVGSHRESEVNPDSLSPALVDFPAGERFRIVSSVPAQRCFEQNRQLEFEA